MPNKRVGDKKTINRTQILSHAETKMRTQNQPNKRTQGHNHRGKQHKCYITRCAKFLLGYDPTKPI